MHVMTAEQAARIQTRTIAVVARMRADADAAAARGDHAGADALRFLADSRERATANARAGARIGAL